MTSKLSDSPTFRQLEKLAIEKGLIKEEKPLIKKAAAKETPKSFSEKILFLCDGLREKGLISYANEIETKFLIYKKAANSLYDVSNEKGEDLIEFAHPEGSKKLDKSWTDLGTVETILDKHQKMLEVVNKKPKGKLASKDIINAAKIVLAQENTDNKITEIVSEGLSYASKALSDLQAASTNMYKADGKTILKQETFNDLFSNLKEAQDILMSQNLDHTKIMQITTLIDDMPNIIIDDSAGAFTDRNNTYLTLNEDGKELFEKAKELLLTAKYRFNAAFELLKGKIQGAQYQLGLGVTPSSISISGTPATSLTSSPNLANTILEFINNLTTSISHKTLPNAKQLLDTLDQFSQYVSDETKDFNSLSSNQKAQEEASYTTNMKEIQNRLNSFKAKWGV